MMMSSKSPELMTDLNLLQRWPSEDLHQKPSAAWASDLVLPSLHLWQMAPLPSVLLLLADMLQVRAKRIQIA